jgi:hypothetical protein
MSDSNKNPQLKARESDKTCYIHNGPPSSGNQSPHQGCPSETAEAMGLWGGHCSLTLETDPEASGEGRNPRL